MCLCKSRKLVLHFYMRSRDRTLVIGLTKQACLLGRLSSPCCPHRGLKYSALGSRTPREPKSTKLDVSSLESSSLKVCSLARVLNQNLVVLVFTVQLVTSPNAGMYPMCWLHVMHHSQPYEVAPLTYPF